MIFPLPTTKNFESKFEGISILEILPSSLFSITNSNMVATSSKANKLANKQIKIFLCFCKKIRSGGDKNERQMQTKG